MADGGRLSWNNVQAPDFTAAMQGLSLAGRSLDQGLGAGQDLATTAQSQLATNADRILQENMMKYAGDPNGLNAASADGSILTGLNPNHLTPDQIASIPGRVSTLLGNQSTGITNATNQQNLDENRYGFNRLQQENTGFDAMKPIFAKIAAAKGDQAAITAIQSDPETQKIMSSLTPDGQSHVNGLVNGIITGRIDQDTAITNLDRNKWQVGVDKRNDNYGQQANALMLELQHVGTKPEQITAYINNHPELKDKYNPTVIMAAMNGTIQQLASQASSGTPGTDGQPSGVDATNSGYNASYGYGQYGMPSKAPTDMTMGEVQDFGDNTLRPATKAAGIGKLNGQTVGTSAMGAYQIEGSTLQRIAPKLFGAGWRDMKFTAENQDRMGEYLFNEAKTNGTDLHSVWEGLPSMSARGKTWDQVRPMILANESSSGRANPVTNQIDLANKVTSAIAALSQNVGGDPDQRFIQNAGAALGAPADAKHIAMAIVAKGQPLEGEDPGLVADKINRISKQYSIAPEVAGQVLSSASSHTKNWVEKIGSKSWWGDGLSHKFNDSDIEHYATLGQNRKALQTAATNANTNNSSVAYLKGALATYQAANQKLISDRQDAIRTGKTVDLSAETAAVNRAASILQYALENGVGAGISGGTEHNDKAPPPAQAGGIPSHPVTRIIASAAKSAVPSRGPITLASSLPRDKINQMFGVQAKPFFQH